MTARKVEAIERWRTMQGKGNICIGVSIDIPCGVGFCMPSEQ
jgi:hypothetical protein